MEIQMKGIHPMGKLRKTLILLFTAAILCGVYHVPVYAAEADNGDLAVENPEETDGFDENAHGEVIKSGVFGRYEEENGPEYKLYADGFLYIYGKGAIGDYVDFSGKSNISDVYIEDGISEIGTEAFYNFSDLERIRIPDSVTRIGGWAFSGCRALQRFEIPSGVSALGSGVFENCDNLKELYISYNVREITVSEDSDTGMFYGINNLEEIVVDERNEYYSSDDGVLYDKEKKKVVFCPQGKREMDILETAVEIGKCAFYNCKNILTLTIPDGVVDIGDNAFYGCEKLENAVMPDTVKSIGYGAFYNCRSLKTWNFRAD